MGRFIGLTPDQQIRQYTRQVSEGRKFREVIKGMGDCHTFVDETRFITRDEELTEAYVFIRAEGDCPPMQGWYHKTFPASKSVLDIITEEIGQNKMLLEWDRGAPRGAAN